MNKLFMLMAAACMCISFHILNDIVITGTVSDTNGKAIPFASVFIKGTRTGVQTDLQGNYSIKAPENAVLVFSSMNFISKEERINNRSAIDITLEMSPNMLQEVIVTSAFNTRRSSRTISSNVQNVSAKQLNTVNSNNTYNALAGKVAGAQIRMRGKASINNNSNFSPDEFNTEGYDAISENNFLKASDNPLSTFSIDVDAASYSNVRRIINTGHLPPAGAVRVEEMINYFKYDYPQPAADQPFSFTTELSDCPWNKAHKLVLIGMQGKNIPVNDLPASNLVFLIDVSGSMMDENKLPLVRSSLKLLTDQLRDKDKVSIVVYAGSAGLVLPVTSGSDKRVIKDAIDRLEAGGSTAGGQGIMLAYKTAKENFISNGNNRVILCTDGDFNVGMSSDDEMETLIEKERASGVFLTVLGYGMGNYKDNKMQKLADKGNGNHAYIDNIKEAKKVLVSEFGGTLFTIAKDVKLQVEFNPAKVQGYRLIGYENRMMKKEDFNDDKKDAGELGSGHTVTALYEIIPVGIKSSFLKSADKLKYQRKQLAKSEFSNEMMTIKFRFKAPGGSASRLTVHAIIDNPVPLAKTSDNFRFVASVSEFGMLLRNSEFKSASTYENAVALGESAVANDKDGFKAEYIGLVKKAMNLKVVAKNNH